MNPLALRAIGALILVALLVGVGYKIGCNAQAVEDQAEFDRINKLLTEQKDEASAKLKKANDDIATRRIEIDHLTAKLGEQHEQNRQLTDRNRTALDALKLRWRAENPGTWDRGGNAQTDSSGAASNPAAAFCQLPDAVDRGIKTIVYQCDGLRDDYKLLYDWSRTVTCY